MPGIFASKIEALSAIFPGTYIVNVLGFLWEEDFYSPENFFDHVHLNRRGADNYTTDLYGKVKQLIGI